MAQGRPNDSLSITKEQVKVISAQGCIVAENTKDTRKIPSGYKKNILHCEATVLANPFKQ